ncbi:hypothetical protein P7C71_g4519, partial [Lecanoromycetidae sp. Uapishka_2]
MSIDIDWDTLTTGPSGLALADSIRDFIHDKFQQVQLPRFIRSVQVHSFDFGKEAPIVEIKDISDPLSEFYEDEESTSSHDSESEDIDNVERKTSAGQGDMDMKPPPQPPSKITKPTFIDTRLPPLHSGITTPFLS